MIRSKIFYVMLSFLLLVNICAFDTYAVPDGSSEDVVDTGLGFYMPNKPALLMEPSSGTILYEAYADEQHFPASTTKVMTALLAVEAIEEGEISLEDVITAGDAIYCDIGPGASSEYIAPGEQMTFEDVLYCAMLSSANEACNIIADEIAGSIKGFVSLMNERAVELGCKGTHFNNAHGMPDENHYSTAKDLAIILSKALEYDLFREIISTHYREVPETNVYERRYLINTNHLIDEDGDYYNPHVLGGKTGYTDAAGCCLVSCANNNGFDLICVMLDMNSEEAVSWANVPQTMQRFYYTNLLYDWGFENYEMQTLAVQGKSYAVLPVEGEASAEEVDLVAGETMEMFLKKGTEVEYDVALINESGVLTAGVEKGQVLGEVAVLSGGEAIYTFEISAADAVVFEEKKPGFLDDSHYSVDDLFGNSKSADWLFITLAIVVVMIFVFIRAAVKRAKRRRERARRRATTVNH